MQYSVNTVWYSGMQVRGRRKISIFRAPWQIPHVVIKKWPFKIKSGLGSLRGGAFAPDTTPLATGLRIMAVFVYGDVHVHVHVSWQCVCMVMYMYIHVHVRILWQVVMANWTESDANYKTKCPYCGFLLVASLTVIKKKVKQVSYI